MEITQLTQAIQEIIEKGEEGNLLYISIDEPLNIQGIKLMDLPFFVIEFPGKKTLGPKHSLSKETEDELKRSGWEAPDHESPDHSKFFDVHKNPAEEIAQFILQTIQLVRPEKDLSEIELEVYLKT